MNTCEDFEALVSAWLDEEIGRDDEVELVDHLVRCPDCRRFYVEARALDGAFALVRSPRTAPSPSPETWTAIEREAARVRPERSVPWWALRAAAAVVIAVGVAGLLWSTGGRGPATSLAPPDALIALGEGAGGMTEERFIEMTKEVLRAEPRYRTAMYRVMRQVVHETAPVEGPADSEFAGALGEERPVIENTGREPV